MFLKFLAWMAIWVIVPFTEKRKKKKEWVLWRRKSYFGHIKTNGPNEAFKGECPVGY